MMTHLRRCNDNETTKVCHPSFQNSVKLSRQLGELELNAHPLFCRFRLTYQHLERPSTTPPSRNAVLVFRLLYY